MNSIAGRVRSLRKKINLTQEEFADKMGVSSGTIANWEAGVISPRHSTWTRFKDLEENYWENKDKQPKDATSDLSMSQRITKLRVDLGLSQTELGQAIGVSDVTIYNWESGKNKPSNKYIPKIEKLEAKAKKQHQDIDVEFESKETPKEEPTTERVGPFVITPAEKLVEDTEEIADEVEDVVEDTTEAVADLPEKEEEEILLFEIEEPDEDDDLKQQAMRALFGLDDTEEAAEPVKDTLLDVLEHKATADTVDFEHNLKEYGPVAGLMKLDEHMRKLKQLNKETDDSNEIMKEALLLLMADAWRTVKVLDTEEDDS